MQTGQNFERHVRRYLSCSPIAAAILFVHAASAANAQSGGFIATLGNDTVHIERFTQTGGVYRGIIVTRIPQTRVVQYTFSPATASAPASASGGGITQYEVATFDANGTPVRTNGAAGSMNWKGDTITRISLKDGVMDTARIPARNGAVPGPTIPYVGITFLSYEAAFAAMRTRADSMVYQLTMIPQLARISATKAWLIGSDSAELNYFGVAKSGYKFDGQGRLLRSDWSNTTYRYHIKRIEAVDVEAIAKQWAAADARGTGFGALSPRDTARFSLNGAELVVDYSRPARRGRDIWGTVVPAGQVWRLGADVATHFTTSRDLRVGDTEVPAGTYTLWMLPQANGSAQLIINKQTKIFGTQYNAANDLARLPLKRVAITSTERLTLAMEDGELTIRWGETAWRVPVVVK